ncbi:hypothetical protein ACFY19_20625 [Streptosporangium saharense]|uniref:hypothetical protein n=1 Tax=Streptosporangium saharense TaxID=1706840 RepID=UPI0036D20517
MTIAATQTPTAAPADWNPWNSIEFVGPLAVSLVGDGSGHLINHEARNEWFSTDGRWISWGTVTDPAQVVWADKTEGVRQALATL